MADRAPFWSWAPAAEAPFAPFATADQVDEHLFVGGYMPAADPAYLARHGITHVVKLFADTDLFPGGACRLPGITYLVLPAEDRPDYDIRPDAVAAVRFIQEAVAKNQRVLVHCFAGISRAPTVALFYLILSRAYSLPVALQRLRLARPVVAPNSGFMRHLQATDARLRHLRIGDERRYVAPPPVSTEDAPVLAARGARL